MIHFVDGAASAIEQARTTAGGVDVQISGGASVIRETAGADLLDDLQIHLTPVLLGSGVRLFDGFDPAVRLEQVRVIDSPEVTHLRYRVRRATG